MPSMGKRSSLFETRGCGAESSFRLDSDRLPDVEANGDGRVLMANNVKIVDAANAPTISPAWLSLESDSR